MGAGLDGAHLLRERNCEVFKRAVQGDPRALSTLLQAARPVVHDWASRRIQDPDDAEDVTQLVLLKLYTRLPGFRGDSTLSSWLYRVTINEICGFYKKRAKERATAYTWLEASSEQGTRDHGLDPVDRTRVKSWILNAAGLLPPLQHTVFTLVDLAGLRPCEAARELGRTQANIRSTLCRARKKIRELVKKARSELVEDLPWEGS